MVKICDNCNAEIEDDSNFCPHCGLKVSGEDIIGKADGAKVMHHAGTFLGIFTSRWGFMFLVIFPTLFAIIYEIMMIIDTRRDMKMASKNEE